MIFLRTETGHEKFKEWSDVLSRENFVEHITTKAEKLSDIFGYYELKDKIHCALTSCNQPHGKGYLVKTESGLETNIGHQCGKAIFGVEFEHRASEFDSFRENEERKLSIQNAKTKLDEWENTLETLRTGDRPIEWAISMIENIQNSNYAGRAAAMEIRSLSRTQDSNVTVDVKVKDKKYEELLFKFNKHFRESGQALDKDLVGTIRNLHVLLTENHMKVLYSSAIANLKEIRECNENQVPSPVLLSLSQKANSLQSQIDKVVSIYNDSLIFLTHKNLRVIKNKLNRMGNVTQKEKEQFNKFMAVL